MAARCYRRPAPDHVPGRGCACGIYAMRNPHDLLDQLTIGVGDANVQVLAKVLLWGKVIEAEYGYRAAWASVVSLAPTGATISVAENVARRYAIALSESLLALQEMTAPTFLVGGGLRGWMPIPPDAVSLGGWTIGLPCQPYEVWRWTSRTPESGRSLAAAVTKPRSDPCHGGSAGRCASSTAWWSRRRPDGQGTCHRVRKAVRRSDG